jgi:tetratricopeptide (TPR) repeat protein
MKRIPIIALLVCVLMPLRSMAQEKAKSNSFILPGAQDKAAPVTLKVDLSFAEPSGNGVLNPGETGELTVAITNSGTTPAKDVKLRISTASRLEGVTFAKDFSVGNMSPADKKNVAISFVAGKTLVDQKAVINVDAIEAATQKTFTAAIEIGTTSGIQAQPKTADRARVVDTLSQTTSQASSADKMSAAMRQLRERLAANPNDNLTRLQLTPMLFNAKLYAEAIAEGEKALVAFPDRPSLYYQVGESERQLKKYDEALKHLERGYKLTKTPFADLAASYALTQLHFGKLQDATVALRTAAAADPTFISKRLASGNEEYKSDDMEDASVEYLAVLILDRSKLTPDQLLFVQFNVDFKNAVESKDPDTVTASFADFIKKKLGANLDYDELSADFRCMVVSKQLDQARNLYNETIVLKAETTNQDTLDRRMLKIAYGLSGDCPEILMKIRIAFIRTIKSLYDLNEEEAKPIYALHEFVLKQNLVSAASEITSSLVGGSIRPENRYVRMADVFLKYRKTDDAVNIYALMLRKKGLDKTGYGADLTKLYSGLLQAQKNDEAQDLMAQLNANDQNDINATFARLADIFTKAGQADKSIEILQKLIQNDPTNVALSIKLGDAFFAKERYDDIITSFANIKTKEGMRYLARAYEKKYKLAEANKTWEDLRKLATDSKEITEIKKHIDDNLIMMMNPDFARLQAEANRPKSTLVAGTEKLKIVIDSPNDGFQTTSNSVEVTGRFLGVLTVQDVQINGKSVGTPRGMKAVETTGQQMPAQDTSKAGLPFTYVVNLNQGKNEIGLRVIGPNADTAESKIVVTMSQTVQKPMTIAEADGIRQSKAYAVIIGVGNYKDPGIPTLKYTVNDARSLCDVLTDPNYGGFKKENVTLLTDQDATMANIKKAIGVDLKRAPEDGIAVVFFAGHGAPEGQQTYWLTYDTDPTSLYASTLSNDAVVDMLNRINTKRVVTFIDACYSGASIKTSTSTRAFVEDPFKAFEGQGTMTITSSDGNQQSLEDGKLKHGIFTYRLLEALQGKADYNADGIVMADEVWKYIKDHVPEDARALSHKQDPKVVANYTGYIPISRNAENVLRNSKTIQVQHFQALYREGKIDGAAYKKIKDIIEGDDQGSKKPIKDYFDKVLTLKDLVELVGK